MRPDEPTRAAAEHEVNADGWPDQSATQNRRFKHRVCGERGGELRGSAILGDVPPFRAGFSFWNVSHLLPFHSAA
jgi:hypothetical protein